MIAIPVALHGIATGALLCAGVILWLEHLRFHGACAFIIGIAMVISFLKAGGAIA